MNRFTLGRFLQEVQRQSRGRILARDIAPLLCPDPRCGAMLYGLVQQDEIIPLSRLCQAEDLMEHIADMSDWDAVLANVGHQTSRACGGRGTCLDGFDGAGLCGCGTWDFFSTGFHGMMDAHDLDRARHCCVHEVRPDGRLIPFCLCNIKYRGA